MQFFKTASEDVFLIYLKKKSKNNLLSKAAVCCTLKPIVMFPAVALGIVWYEYCSTVQTGTDPVEYYHDRTHTVLWKCYEPRSGFPTVHSLVQINLPSPPDGKLSNKAEMS